MEEGWTHVYSLTDEFHAEMLKRYLADHDLIATIINKRDSHAFLIGDLEIYVPSHHALRAIQLIKEFEKE